MDVSVQWYTECLGFTLRRKAEDLAVVEPKAGPLLVLVQADKDSRGHFTKDGLLELSVGFTSPRIHQLRQCLIERGVEVEEM
ncbi:hypothetical protein PCURB6_16110 [Paenibacillus curdlanolyticus]|nr:hypothetical protein PCURB6_16110 [Paenibacillus curdlanolyticus]